MHFGSQRMFLQISNLPSHTLKLVNRSPSYMAHDVASVLGLRMSQYGSFKKEVQVSYDPLALLEWTPMTFKVHGVKPHSFSNTDISQHRCQDRGPSVKCEPSLIWEDCHACGIPPAFMLPHQGFGYPSDCTLPLLPNSTWLFLCTLAVEEYCTSLQVVFRDLLHM